MLNKISNIIFPTNASGSDGGLNASRVYGGINGQKCMMAAMLFKNIYMYFSMCIFPNCIFVKCTRLACLLSFASLFLRGTVHWMKDNFVIFFLPISLIFFIDIKYLGMWGLV